MGRVKYLLLSFDLEEFDVPLEFGGKISFEEQIDISYNGALNVLKLLDTNKIQATFYVTANFALQKPEFIKELSLKHEIASHGYYHSDFSIRDLKRSREVLENIIGKPVYGYRMARMMPINDNDIYNAGYKYNSSLNPTYLPGRYNNFFKPRTLYSNKDLFNIPSSVTPIIRIPLFWLSFKNFPFRIFKLLASWTLVNDAYLNIYFHPWEFIGDINNPNFQIPNYIKKQSDIVLLKKLEKFIIEMGKSNKFITTNDYLNLVTNKNNDEKNY